MNNMKSFYYMLAFPLFSNASVLNFYYKVIVALVLHGTTTINGLSHVEHAELRVSLDQVLKQHLADWNDITTSIDTHMKKKHTLHQNIEVLTQNLYNNIQPQDDDDLQSRISWNKPIGPPRDLPTLRPLRKEVAGNTADYTLGQSRVEVLPSILQSWHAVQGSQSIPEGPPRSKLVRQPRAISNQDDDLRGARQPRQHQGGQMPVMYMTGDSKRKRQCAQVNGILAGFNTFSYLTFVNGVITLILNANNNINNNNNNNNINNNNDISNNNLNSNSNTQNANQVIIMPPGRKKRRSIIEAIQSSQEKSSANCINQSTTSFDLYRLCNL